MIKRGSQQLKHRRARNFVQQVAQTRLEDTVHALNDKSKNALAVDSVECIIYNKIPHGPPCTCEETEVHPEMMVEGNVPPNVEPQGERQQHITINRKANLFGEVGESYTSEHEAKEDQFTNTRVADIMSDSDASRMIDNVFAGHNTDCGVCYRRGTVPGYMPLMWQRELLTTHNMLTSEGFWINPRNAPHTIERQHDQGYVEFVIMVPREFRHVYFSVRNNHDIISDPLYSGSGELTLADIAAARGRTLTVRVRSKVWTHAVVEFDTGVEIRGNISEVTQAKDYSQLESFSSITLILPPSVSKMSTSDVIVLPKLDKVLKVSDVTYKRTAELSRYAEWSVQTRILQPQEVLRYIHDGTEVR
jgi:hypothetical protein